MIDIKSDNIDWFETGNVSDIVSPALLFYPDRIEENIRHMIAIAGKPERLFPHVKTHKTAEIVRLQINQHIQNFKCSTVSEVQMVASCGAKNILLAMQPVGPVMYKLTNFIKQFPAISFSVVSDSLPVIKAISSISVAAGIEMRVWLDINNGMNRTGIVPDENALYVYKAIYNLPGLTVAGLHVYDGHIHESDFEIRKKICDQDFNPVLALVERLKKAGMPVPAIIAGGTPTFPAHALRNDIFLSPGTILLWDQGYGEHYPDLKFRHAAVLLTRIISKPLPDMLCLDLGHKAVASEMPHPRVRLIGINQYVVTNHSEEHLVIQTPEAGKWNIGDHLYAIPYHICPTVAKYKSAYVIKNHQIQGEWQITARDRN